MHPCFISERFGPIFRNRVESVVLEQCDDLCVLGVLAGEFSNPFLLVCVRIINAGSVRLLIPRNISLNTPLYIFKCFDRGFVKHRYPSDTSAKTLRIAF